MKVDVQKLAGLQRKLNIEVPVETVNAAMERMFKEVQKTAKFKGFRPGKAPMNMVVSQYKAQVQKDVVEKLILDHYELALDQNSLNPVSYPEIEFEGLKDGDNLKFSAVFEVRPEIKLTQHTGFHFSKEKVEVSDDRVNEIIENIRKSRATLIPVLELRPVAKGDVAIIDFEGTVTGQGWQGSSGKEVMVEVGEGKVFQEIEDALVGMQPGTDKTVIVTLPADFEPKEVANMQAVFKIQLKEIKKNRLPEVDDEFAKSLGKYENLAALKTEIITDLKGSDEKRVNDDLRNRVFETLVEKNPFDVPQSMVANQKNLLIDDAHHRMEQQGMPHEQFEEYKKKWDADFQKTAEFMIRSGLLLTEVAKAESLNVTDAEVDAKVSGYAEKSGIELEKVKGFYSKPENRNRLRFQMLEDKVVESILSKSTVVEVPPVKSKNK